MLTSLKSWIKREPNWWWWTLVQPGKYLRKNSNVQKIWHLNIYTYFRCGPCKNIAPYVEELSNTYPNAHFLNVDVDECQETAASYGITAMPTFIFLRNKTRLALVKGADKAGLESKIKQFYTDASQDEEVGVKGMVSKAVKQCVNWIKILGFLLKDGFELFSGKGQMWVPEWGWWPPLRSLFDVRRRLLGLRLRWAIDPFPNFQPECQSPFSES